MTSHLPYFINFDSNSIFFSNLLENYDSKDFISLTIQSHTELISIRFIHSVNNNTYIDSTIPINNILKYLTPFVSDNTSHPNFLDLLSVDKIFPSSPSDKLKLLQTHPDFIFTFDLNDDSKIIYIFISSLSSFITFCYCLDNNLFSHINIENIFLPHKFNDPLLFTQNNFFTILTILNFFSKLSDPIFTSYFSLINTFITTWGHLFPVGPEINNKYLLNIFNSLLSINFDFFDFSLCRIQEESILHPDATLLNTLDTIQSQIKESQDFLSQSFSPQNIKLSLEDHINQHISTNYNEFISDTIKNNISTYFLTNQNYIQSSLNQLDKTIISSLDSKNINNLISNHIHEVISSICLTDEKIQLQIQNLFDSNNSQLQSEIEQFLLEKSQNITTLISEFDTTLNTLLSQDEFEQYIEKKIQHSLISKLSSSSSFQKFLHSSISHHIENYFSENFEHSFISDLIKSSISSEIDKYLNGEKSKSAFQTSTDDRTNRLSHLRQKLNS